MNTREALEALGVNERSMTGEQRSSLDELGYFIVEDVFSPEQCERMAVEVDRMAAEEGERAGHEVSIEAGSLRVSNVFNKSTAFDGVLACKPLLAAAYYLLGEFKVHGANVREPQLGHGLQPIHADSHKLKDGGWCLVNSLITFDPMTLDNGPTRIIPGSHKWPAFNVPGENALDYAASRREQPHRWASPGDNVEEHIAQAETAVVSERIPDDPFAPYPGEVKVTVPAGAVVVLNAHMWHSGTKKLHEGRRRQLHLSYTRRDMPQQLDQRRYLTPALFERMNDAHRFLLDIA